MKSIHESWEFMNPNENEKHFKFEEYYQRVSGNEKLRHIPKAVFEQWIYGLHYDDDTLKNYAWINYENVEFNLCEWDFNDLAKVYVIKKFEGYFKNRSSYNDFAQFACDKKNLDFWKANGTWRIPPIILDVGSLTTKIPKGSDLISPYQLVEGHTRLGHLNSMKRISDLSKREMASKHAIYLMSEKVR